MTPPPNELKAILDEWIRRRPLGFGGAETAEQTEVPGELLSTITAREPYRSRVLGDAPVWLSLPIMAGIGLEAILEPDPRVGPYMDWTQSIGPVRFEANWSRDMTGRETDGFQMELKRVAVEDGAWKIVELWDAGDREKALDELRAIRKLRGK